MCYNHFLQDTPLFSEVVNDMCLYFMEQGQFDMACEMVAKAPPTSLIIGQILKAMKTGVKR